jgi:putative ABC transport system permease protein
MISIKLALKNLLGAGLRTWLNVGVLSFTFVVIVFYNGMLDGWNKQAMNDTRAWETGSGQVWHTKYDRFDPFSLAEAHAPLSAQMNELVQQGKLTPILIAQGSVFPEGRMINVLIKGIDPAQRILDLPTTKMDPGDGSVSAMVGKRMAKMAHLSVGDRLMVQWRDKHGTFDAMEVVIADVFHCNVPSVDQGQIWIPLEDLQEMTGMKGEATMLVAGEPLDWVDSGIWQFKDEKFLLRDYQELMDSKKSGSRVIYGLLLAISLLAIFDTQVLSVFRRQREIGTYMALGMTRWQVVRLFTMEGSAHSILALLVGAAYGIPILLLINHTGIPMPAGTDDMGISITDSIIPAYSLGMIATSVLLVVVSATLVSYYPASRIAKMKPTDALKGKIQ